MAFPRTYHDGNPEDRDFVGDFASEEAYRSDIARKYFTCLAVEQHAPQQCRKRVRASCEQASDDSGKRVAASGDAETRRSAFVGAIGLSVCIRSGKKKEAA